MEIIASAIFGRSSFTFRLSRMISFTYQYAHCPSNRIYKRALGVVSPNPKKASHSMATSLIDAKTLLVQPPSRYFAEIGAIQMAILPKQLMLGMMDGRVVNFVSAWA